MNKAIEFYIEPAMQELINFSNTPVVIEKYNRKIPMEYKGYISSLGASIIMSGLIPTLAFYSSKENSAKNDRGNVLKWIINILKINAVYNHVDFDDIFSYAREVTTNKKKLEQEILNVSIALKLCIRTFELTN